jgi:ATP-dependent RNA/DNA helicase IGHMBP2
MNYFSEQLELLRMEKDADRLSFKDLTHSLSTVERRESGMCWFPVAIRDTEIGRGDYLTIELERTTHQDIVHQFRFGMTASLFSNHDVKHDRIDGTIAHISGNRLKLSLRVDELPDWTRNGKLGVDIVFDENSYNEMENALRQANANAEKKDGRLIRVLTGELQPAFNPHDALTTYNGLNETQQLAVNRILDAADLAIVHGPPGTGKTTTLVQAIRAMLKRDGRQILVVAPSNAAVDLLSEKLAAAGLNVVRVGNPAKVSENQMSLTLDSKITSHNSMKEIRRLRKQASEYRDLAHKYKRSFGRDEREQRKALFAEARKIAGEVEKTEQYIIDDVLSRAQVITATLVGANHYTVRQRMYDTVVIDEAGQALEAACWVPILKSKKVVMAGDHCQLPPTIKSQEAAKQGLSKTLMEKMVEKFPEAVVLLQTQYRMHNAIMQFSSNEFYGGNLLADESVASRLLFEGDEPVLFIDTAGSGYEEKLEGKSISNPEEAEFVVTHLVRLITGINERNNPALPSIGVISPYRHQVTLLKELVLGSTELQEYSSLITVNTIDSFQGQERDIVYISLARSNPDNTIGFLSEVRRMNVAMTRARMKLVVIGDSATIAQFPFYADFIEYVEKIGGYKSVWDFME